MQNYRHGDIRLKRVEFIPDGSTKTKESNHYIIASGKTTGHEHCLESLNMEIWKKNEVIFIVLNNTGILTHSEHNTISISTGCYEVIYEREYDPFSERHKRAFD